ncbi:MULTISPECIES: HAD-IA family hydrolase [Streptomyces]|uniref:HAD-IA family hydrolase n=1 Tax=Streptomyces sp. 900129855 TaxID=3155129 RepID=A0ABV2ZZT4_9ACTN
MTSPNRNGAIVFDVDGTLVDSERDGHRIAFNSAFSAAGLPYQWDVETYGRLLQTTGGRRRIAAFLRRQGHSRHEAEELAATLHTDKTARFRAMVEQGTIPPRPGVRALLTELSDTGVTLAVATTGTRVWVEPLLDNLFGRGRFACVVTGTEVPTLKPDPGVYLQALDGIGLRPNQAIAVEDSVNGLRAAQGAGLRCLVVTNHYTSNQNFTGALAVLDRFLGHDVATLLRCHLLHDTAHISSRSNTESDPR